jgi:hypothetical protein
MHSPSIPGRGLAILAGIALYIGSLSALFGEDLLNWSNWTMKHYEVMVASLGTMAFGLLLKYAKRARMWWAAAGFALLFVAGTCFVVYKSIGRQAVAITTQSTSAEDTNDLIADKVAELKLSRQRLQDAEREVDLEQKGRPDRNGKATKKEGCGKDCQNWKQRATEVRSHIRGLEQELKTIGPRQVAAPEAETFAQFLGIFGWSVPKVKTLAILLFPIAWTLFLEFGSIWCFEYGFGFSKYPPAASSDVAGKLAEIGTLPESNPPRGGRQTSTLPASSKPKTIGNVVHLPGKHPVVSALEIAGKHLSNEELAKAMGCCGGEASKRRREVADAIYEYRRGHCIMVGLKLWQRERASPRVNA